MARKTSFSKVRVHKKIFTRPSSEKISCVLFMTPVAVLNTLEKKGSIHGAFSENSEFLELFQVMSK